MFYVLAALLVASALVALALPSTRASVVAVMVFDVLVGVLLMAAGSLLLGVIALVAPAAVLAVVVEVLRRNGYGDLIREGPAFAGSWPVVVVAGALLTAIVAFTANDSAPGDHVANTTASLLTVLHYRTPVAAGVALATALVALLGAVLIGRTGDDERHVDATAELRRLREDRAAARRQNRAAAAQARRQRRGDA
ncbi:MAG: hypothetical protein ACYDAC_05405 [Candidatus Dormibacteria bacterium]